jgi:hypothetical protein
MTIRSQCQAVTFKHSFRLRGIDRLLLAGPYSVVIDMGQINGLSLAAFRCAVTMIKLPRGALSGPTTELLSIGSAEPSYLQRIDVSASDD